MDTHTFIWFTNCDQYLSDKVISKIKDIENQCFLSIPSIREIAIKLKLNKLYLKSDFNKIVDFCYDNEIDILPITFEHIQALNNLDFHHRGPFDRLIIAQSIAEELTVLTKDENFHQYKVKCFW